MNKLRNIAALNGNLKRLFVVTGAGVVYSLASSSSSYAEDTTVQTPPETSDTSTATSVVVVAPTPVDTVTAQVETAQTTLDTTVSSATSYQVAQNTTVIAEAQTAINNAVTAVEVATSAASDVSAATTTVVAATTELNNATQAVETQTAVVATSVENVSVAQTAVETATATVATDTQVVVTATETKSAADAVISANTEPGLTMTVYSNPGTNRSPAMGGNLVYTGTDTNGIDEQWGGGGPTVNGPTTTTTVTETFAGNHLNTNIGITVNGTPVSTTWNNGVYIGSIGFPTPGQDPSLSLQTPTAPTVITMPTNTTAASFDVFAKNGNSTATVTYTDGTTDTFVIQDDVNPNYPGYVHKETITAPTGKTISNITIPTDWDYYGIDNVSATKTTTSTTTVTEDFQVRWQGLWTPQTTGTQYVTASADDGTRLYLDGQLVIDDWFDKGGGGSTADIPTTAGVSKTFDFWFYENGGGANVSLLRYTGNGWEVIPASEFSVSTATPEQIAVAQAAATALNAANATLSTSQEVLTSATATLSAAQTTLTTEQANLTTLQEVKTTAQTNVDSATAALDTAQTVLTVALATAQSLADTATAKVATAVAAVSSTPTQAPAPAPVWTPAPEPVPTPEPPAPVEQPSPEETTTPQPDPTPEPETPSDVPTDVTDTSTDTSSTDSSSTDSSNSDTSQSQDSSSTQSDTPSDSSNSQSDSSTPSTQPSTPDSLQPETQPSTPPTSPDSLPTTVPLVPPASALVAHIQVDQPGVANGGIQFFGTKSQPQVVGEDGKLTPPPPPPGSGLPIPPDAITTADTFIGQPGGTTFNAPDIAVPVEVTYVCKTFTKEDGTEVHLDVDGNEHPIEQCQFLPAALDAIPGAGAAVQAMSEAFAALSNIGNDMSPITRKKAKKILVVTVVGGIVFRRRFGE